MNNCRLNTDFITFEAGGVARPVPVFVVLQCDILSNLNNGVVVMLKECRTQTGMFFGFFKFFLGKCALGRIDIGGPSEFAYIVQ